MTKLSSEIVQTFYANLTASSTKSDFDAEFLINTPLETISEYSTEQWIALFKNRLHRLLRSEYDWTRIGQNGVTWSGNPAHANYHWFELAKSIAHQTHQPITKIIFPEIAIAAADEKRMTVVESFGAFFYDDNFTRLVLLDRVVTNAVKRPTSMASYDPKGGKYALSLQEMAQIYLKIAVPRRTGEVKSWKEFQERFVASWHRANKNRTQIEDLLYPLYEIVQTYFFELEEEALPNETLSLLQNFYRDHLKELDIECVNYFYGQTINGVEGDEGEDYLSDLMMQVMLRAQRDLHDALPKMIKLAVWITAKNPAQMIEHPQVMDNYRRMGIGPYIHASALATELDKLADYKDEFTPIDMNLIARLSMSVRVGLIYEKSFFEDFYALFVAREEYNYRTTYRDIGKEGIFKGSFEYVYHRIDANAVFIKMAHILFALKIPQRYGLEDPYQLLMPELKSAYDNVSGRLLSTYPLSHYVRLEDDRTYLALLDHSAKNYELNHGFDNVNKVKPSAFSVREYACIQAYSASRFRKFPRVPELTQYSLKAKTLTALASLVNKSLDFDATLEGDDYKLQEGLSPPKEIRTKFIQYILVENKLNGDKSIIYQIRDRWQEEVVHRSTIYLNDEADKQAFIMNAGDSLYRLMFILNVAVTRGHARPNLSIARYFSAYLAYDKLREFCNLLRVEYVASVIRRELLSHFMNLYPLEQRYALLARCSQESIELLLLNNKAEFKAIIAEKNVLKLANFFFYPICQIEANPMLLEPDNLSILHQLSSFLEYNPNFFDHYEADEYSHLMNTSMRFDDTVRTFGEIWANGFPDCMSTASKWFSILLADHLPDMRFSNAIETAATHIDYLGLARRRSQRLYEKYHSREEANRLSRQLSGGMHDNSQQPLTNEIADMLKITDDKFIKPAEYKINRSITLFGDDRRMSPPACTLPPRVPRWHRRLVTEEPVRKLSSDSTATTPDAGSVSSSYELDSHILALHSWKKNMGMLPHVQPPSSETTTASITDSSASSSDDENSSNDQLGLKNGSF